MPLTRVGSLDLREPANVRCAVGLLGGRRPSCWRCAAVQP